MNKQDAMTLAQAACRVIAPAPGDGMSLTERVLALLESEPSLAGRHFAMQIVRGCVEDALDEALLAALGVDYNEPTAWPCTHITYDYYDSSFELKHTRSDWQPTADGLTKVWALGFSRGWVCYGGEKHGSNADPNYRERYYAAPNGKP